MQPLNRSNQKQNATLTIKPEALVDLAAVIATLVIIKQWVLHHSFLYAGPASTFTAMIVATWILKKRGLKWQDLGLRKPSSWLKTWGLSLLVFIVFAIYMQLSDTLASQFFKDVGTSGRFDHIEGDLTAYLIIMFLTWTHAAFFEELLFRAYIINRTACFLGGGLKADLLAVVFSAVFFGYRHHYYQGMHGAFTTGMAGLVLGLFYIWFGRQNILPLVLTHGVVNSLGQTLRFLGIKDDD